MPQLLRGMQWAREREREWEREWEREREQEWGLVCLGMYSTGVGGAPVSRSRNRGRTCRVQWSNCCCECSEGGSSGLAFASDFDWTLWVCHSIWVLALARNGP